MRVGAAAVLCACTAPLAAQTPGISDNSFLVEEAYNQNPRVVQHISTWQRSLRTGSWNFAFTQEWPVGSQLHQLSYNLLVGYAARTNLEFSGVGFNYRYQLTPADNRVAVAPRVSALVPRRGHVGVQVALPVSVEMGSQFVSHWNADVTVTPRTTTIYNLGGSVVWLAQPTFNLLYEVTWVSGPEGAVLLMNPGVRWAYNFASGLQIVPGLAYTYGVGPSRGAQGAFVYLSFEHPFGGKSDPN
ncbi:MAG TPA: hypothetical protein VGU74_12265 [Gemmatimonadales bacterium]|nr:hypothetical protein [Gemmatimonadales bacterium]